MRQIIAFSLVLLVMTGCTKDTIDFYGKTNYIYFANDSENVIEYSFAFHPGAERDTVPLVIKLVGNLSTEDRPVSLKVDAANTTALESDFELPATVVLRAGRATDTIPLVLHHSDRLQQAKFAIQLTLNENEHFSLGPIGNRQLEVLFSDILARPAWWNDVVTTNFLGPYSDAKYRFFIEATGIADMGDLSENEQRAYAIIFRDFLAQGREQGEEYLDENEEKINVSPNLT